MGAVLVVDGLDHPEYCGGVTEAAKGLWRYLHGEQANGSATPVLSDVLSLSKGGAEGLTAGLERLTEYTGRLGNRTVFKRLGYLSEVLGLPVGEYLERWRGEISSGTSLLDPRAGQRGKYSTRWNLRLNVESGQLTEWLEH